MRWFSLFFLFSLVSSFASATEIVVTSEDCNFEVRRERDATVIRINKIIAVANSVSVVEVELPRSLVKIPLQEGLKTSFPTSSGDETSLSYRKGLLTHTHLSSSSSTRDVLELRISRDLKQIRQARFSRKGTGILSLFGSEKFECTF